LWFLGPIILFLVIIKIVGWWTGQVHPDKYEYLDVLSFAIWKRAKVVRKEMEKRKGGWIALGHFYVAMAQLEDEGWIEGRQADDPPEVIAEHGGYRTREYKLTENGMRKRHEILNPQEEVQGVPVI
jgi:DNA-binding PadR family transcriptional regulator